MQKVNLCFKKKINNLRSVFSENNTCHHLQARDAGCHPLSRTCLRRSVYIFAADGGKDDCSCMRLRSSGGRGWGRGTLLWLRRLTVTLKPCLFSLPHFLFPLKDRGAWARVLLKRGKWLRTLRQTPWRRRPPAIRDKDKLQPVCWKMTGGLISNSLRLYCLSVASSEAPRHQPHISVVRSTLNTSLEVLHTIWNLSRGCNVLAFFLSAIIILQGSRILSLKSHQMWIISPNPPGERGIRSHVGFIDGINWRLLHSREQKTNGVRLTRSQSSFGYSDEERAARVAYRRSWLTLLRHQSDLESH